MAAATATEGPTPTAEEKTRIMTAKKELIQALVKKRALDKQLVRSTIWRALSGRLSCVVL
jgi:hypothetical protein